MSKRLIRFSSLVKRQRATTTATTAR